nr:MAG TPA: hypothetical protein [Bacteriophage sp.]
MQILKTNRTKIYAGNRLVLFWIESEFLFYYQII